MELVYILGLEYFHMWQKIYNLLYIWVNIEINYNKVYEIVLRVSHFKSGLNIHKNTNIIINDWIFFLKKKLI